MIAYQFVYMASKITRFSIYYGNEWYENLSRDEALGFIANAEMEDEKYQYVITDWFPSHINPGLITCYMKSSRFL